MAPKKHLLGWKARVQSHRAFVNARENKDKGQGRRGGGGKGRSAWVQGLLRPSSPSYGGNKGP